MDTDNDQNLTPTEGQTDDSVSDSVMDSMAAALESAGISLRPDEPVPEPEKRYSDEVMRQVVTDLSIEDEDSYIEFAKTMDGDENGYLNKQELLDAAEAWKHMQEVPEVSDEQSIEDEVNT
ncbi:MAG: hypothetical protein QNL20_03060, partial [Euryarchaeota archaeon]